MRVDRGRGGMMNRGMDRRGGSSCGGGSGRGGVAGLLEGDVEKWTVETSTAILHAVEITTSEKKGQRRVEVRKRS